MPLIFSAITFFVFAELFALFGGSWLWLVLLLLAIYWIFRRENQEDFQDISLVGTSLLFFFLNFYLQVVFDLGFLAKQIHLLILLMLFIGLLKFYEKKIASWRANIFPVILITTSAFLGVWFFHIGILENLFFKEVLFFLGTLLIFRSGQRVIFLSLDSKNVKSKQFLYPWLGNMLAALVLTQLAWLLSFLPINFLSLTGIWLLCFYLVWEFFNWFWQRKFHLSRFVSQTAWIVILIIILMSSANWGIV